MTALSVFLAPGSLGHIANTIKGFALAIGVVLAVAFVWMWWSTRLRERQQEMAARARAAYSAHLRLGLQNPELAEPMAGSMATPAEIVRYKQFVASLLSTADEILLLDPDETWRATLARQLVPHAAYLKSEEFRAEGFASCTPAVQGLVRTVSGG